ncbi:methyltransferase domain-containing protein [candidate division KSB1 bacterium]|nr:methyltransferase domain-containing protein [candidate division KSB1 bacterium]
MSTHETIDLTLNAKIIEHFQNPRNIGELEHPDGFAVVGDPSCGDHIKVWLKVEDEIITDFKYKVFGCWGAISTTSVVSELAIGKSLKQASLFTDDDVVRELGGIPQNKQHCSLLGIQGLRTAIADFLIKDNHRKFSERIEQYRAHGYDFPLARDLMVNKIRDLPKSANVLDVGTGKGHLALAIARSGRKCISVDISEEEIHYARLNAIYYKLDNLIRFENQDARHLKFENDHFDAVMTAAFMHHLKNPEPVLNEFIRVSKLGTKIVISDFNENGLKMVAQKHREDGKTHDVHGWRMEEVQKWFENQQYSTQLVNEEFETIVTVTTR